MIRMCDPCPGGVPRRHALLDDLHPFRSQPPCDECRASQDRALRQPQWKPMRGGGTDSGFGPFLSQGHLTAEAMEPGGEAEGEGHTMRVRQRLRQPKRLVAPV